MRKKSSTPQQRTILGGFVPIACLWQADGAKPALFPSEWSARHFLLTRRAELVESQALAMHVGRLHFHPKRFEQVATRIALRDAGPSTRTSEVPA